MTTMQLGHIRTLRGTTKTFGSLGHAEFDEIAFERNLAGYPGAAHLYYWVRKCRKRGSLRVTLLRAIEASLEGPAAPFDDTKLEVAEYDFLPAGLPVQHGWDSAMADQRPGEHFGCSRSSSQTARGKYGSENCPENFGNRAALVGAEIARIEGRALDAIELYEQAIRSARANSFVQNEALAYEVAARVYASRGLGDFAEIYLVKARDGYRRWGADGKVRQLESRYSWLAMAEPRGATRATTSPDQQLDVAAVVKASQALSSEMLLPRLIERLMTIALQNAGADRGLLILSHQSDYRIEAEARADGELIVLHDVASARPAVPESIVRYVMRSQECVILDDATKQNLFSEDPYLALRQARSILCLPLIRQGTLVGLLYLENALASHVFTPDRARLLELLAGQAAISLENTRLYGDLREREAKVRRLVDSNIIGICIFGFDGRIIEANEAFLQIVGYGQDDLTSGRLRWNALTPPEWNEADQRALRQRWLLLEPAGLTEKEFSRNDDSRVPVLVAAAIFGELRHQGVAFALDLTERKRADAELRDAERRNLDTQLQLAHVNRIATMGQLAASIAHEVNQPIGAMLSEMRELPCAGSTLPPQNWKAPGSPSAASPPTASGPPKSLAGYVISSKKPPRHGRKV